VILVCGLPSSGNRLVETHIRRGIDAKGVEETVQIWHGDNERPMLIYPEGERLVMVAPVRDEAMRQASIEKRERYHGGHFPTDPERCRRNMLSLKVEMDLPIYFLSYEGLIANPGGLGRNLFGWLELPWVPWPTEESHDPAQPYLGALYDANDAYRGHDVPGKPS
jgi:hypothetical protein